jgi:hypothetical protein
MIYSYRRLNLNLSYLNLILGLNIPTVMHFITMETKCYMLLTYCNYSGEETNTLVNHLTTEFERRLKHGTFDL